MKPKSVKKLDAEETALLAAYGRGDFSIGPATAAEKAEARRAAPPPQHSNATSE